MRGFRRSRLLLGLLVIVPALAQPPAPRPSIRPPPEQNVSPAPNAPTRRPSLRPTARPTIRPTIQPTSKPTSVPTRKPSDPPVRSPTSAPVSNPTSNPTLRSLEQVFTPAQAPISFKAELLTQQSQDEMVSQLETIWESYILARFKATYRKDEQVTVNDVNLTVTVLDAKNVTTTQNRRGLQQLSNGTQVSVESVGQASFDVDTTRQSSFSTDVQDQLDTIITKQSLQQALVLAQNPAIVQNVENTSRGEPYRHVPTTAEVVVGFLLLTLTVISLLFWSHVLWKKRQKRVRKRRQAAMRKSASAVVSRAPPTSPAAGNISMQSVTPHRVSSLQTARMESSSDDDDNSSYNGLGDSEDEDEESDTSEFGRELRMAASLDQKAWDEFQRKKQQLEAQNRELSGSSSPGFVGTLSPAVVGLANGNGGEQYDEGMEVDMSGAVMPTSDGGIQRASSFPYGDENDVAAANLSQAAVGREAGEQEALELTLNDAVEWTPTGISLKVPPGEPSEEDGGDFEPYGDKNVGQRSLEQSWDLNAIPVTDTDGPSQYSFLYPLKRQELSDNTQASPAGTTESQSSAAINANTTVSSWSTAGAVVTSRTENSFESARVIREESEGSDSEDDILTSEMLKEVSRLSHFVKRYEQKKELRKKVQDEMEEKQEPHTSNISSLNTTSFSMSIDDSRSPRRVEYEPTNSQPSPLGVSPKNRMVAPTARSERASQLRVTTSDEKVDDPSVEPYDSSSEESEDDGGRLGISRYRVAKPSAPMLAYSPRVDQGESDQRSPAAAPGPPPPPPQRSPATAQGQTQSAVVRPGAVTRSGALSTLRKNRAVLDGEVSEEMGVPTKTAPSKPLDETVSGPPPQPATSTPKGEAAKPSTPKWTRNFDVSPRARSKSKSFNNIVTMFEAKPKNAVVPPNEHWQYEK